MNSFTFSEYLYSLTEAGKNPVKINWKKSASKWESDFEIEDVKYHIYANIVMDCDGTDVWEFKFFKDGNITQITGDFKAHFRIIPTIALALDDFVKEVKPDILVFLASDENQARKRLYKANSDSIASKYKYISVNPNIPKNDILFGICKTDKMLNCLKGLIGV